MAAVSLQLGRTVLVDIWTCILALAAVVLLLHFKINSAWLVLGGALIGWLIQTNS
jgi:chromate transporter